MSICLAMICKNESKFIREALKSVKPFISHWSIMDTGSSDDTQEIIREEMAEIPGTLHERPWKNYGESRTECLDLAKQSGAEYLFILDADEVVCDLILPEVLDPDTEYWIAIHFGSIVYQRPNLISMKHKYEYRGITHEYLTVVE